MDVPPPLPRKGFSPFLLIALLLVLLAVVVRTILGVEQEGEDVMKSAWQSFWFGVVGLLAAVTAVIFSLVALFDRRRGWPLSILIGLAGAGVAWLILGELRQPLQRMTSETRSVLTEASGSAADGVALARQPIPQKKGALTGAMMEPSLVAWGEDAMVRPYQEHGHHDAAWDDAALALIRGTVLELARSAARPGPANLRVLGAKILRTDCDDPWVLFLIRRLGEDDSDHREVMAAAAAALAKAGYPPFPLWLAQVEALGAAQREDPAAAEALVPSCLESLGAALTVKPLTAADYRIWCALFRHSVGDRLLEQNGDGACRVVESIPETPPWFRLWLRGSMEIDLAWRARGSGWANGVTAEQWQRFEQHLAAAREALEQAFQLQPQEPQIASTLMTVEMGSAGLPEMRSRFDAAMQAQFDFMPAYDSLRQGLLPRWFGSSAAVLAFGRNCLATQRFDTRVPWQMVMAVRDVAKDSGNANAYYFNQSPWKDLEATIDGYLAHGDPARRNYYLSMKLYFAAGRRLDSIVDQMLEQLNYQIDPQVVAEENLPVEWLSRMISMHGPARRELVAAEAVETKQPEQALQHLLAAQKIPGLAPIATAYVDDLIGDQKAIIALNAAPWQPLTPPQDLAGWKVGSGEWKVLSPTLLEVTTGSSGARLTRLEPIGDTWEVRGTFQLLSRRGGRAEATLFCGPSEQDGHSFSLRFWTSPHGWSGISLAGGPRDEAVGKTTGFSQATPFFVRLDNHRLRASTSSGPWLADQPLPESAKIDAGALLSLGSTTGEGRTVQFQNLEWRVPSRRN